LYSSRVETAGCAAIYHLGILAWFKVAMMTVYGVDLTIVLGCADNAPSGYNVLSNCFEKLSEVQAEDELHVEVDCLGPFHCHESEFPDLQGGGLRADITDDDRQVINQLRHSEHFVNNPQRLAILDSFIKKGYTRQLEFYGRVPLVLWLFKEIKRRVDNVDIDMETDEDMMDIS